MSYFSKWYASLFPHTTPFRIVATSGMSVYSPVTSSSTAGGGDLVAARVEEAHDGGLLRVRLVEHSVPVLGPMGRSNRHLRLILD